jgi:ligand-binding sensor domain-containing protein/signal transduction histidine kinase
MRKLTLTICLVLLVTLIGLPPVGYAANDTSDPLSMQIQTITAPFSRQLPTFSASKLPSRSSPLADRRNSINGQSATTIAPKSQTLLPDPPQLHFDRLSAADGLSFSLATVILQDQQGFMWFGTRYGLNKYDGFNFTVYNINPGGSDPMFENAITALYQDHNGSLWIGTYVDLVRRDSETGDFIHYKNDAANSQTLTPGSITTIGEDSLGTLLVGTQNGLNRYNPATDTFDRVTEGQVILSFFADRQGGTWLGTTSGLWHYNLDPPGQQEPEIYKNVPSDLDSLISNYVTEVYVDHQDVVWVGTIDGGLNRLDRSTGKFTHFGPNSYDLESLSDNAVRTVLEDDNGRLWIGTDNGLNLFDQATESFYKYYNDPADLSSLANNRVMDLYSDRSGVVWIATPAGISKVNEVASQFTHYQQGANQSFSAASAQTGNRSGLSDIFVESVYQDSHSILWIGTVLGGLNRLDRNTGTVTVFRHDQADLSSLNNDEVIAIYEDQAGTLWIGSSGGLDEFIPGSESFKSIGEFLYRPVSAIVEDQLGSLWIGYWGGILRRSPGGSTFDPVPGIGELFSGKRVNKIYPDRTGAIWISTQDDGLFRVDMAGEADGVNPTVVHFPQNASDPKSPGASPMMSFYEDAQGTLWLSSIADGLMRFDRDTQEFTHFQPDNGTISYVSCILGDNDGFLWIGTKLGLARFDPRSETFYYYDAHDGLSVGESLTCYQNEQGEMFFGGMQGLSTFFPDQVHDNPIPPLVVITALNQRNQVLRTDLSPDELIELSYEDNYLSFDFVALDYHAPAKNQYTYKMEGVDTDWIEAGTRRHADYPELRPGTYTFRVKASNNSGIWNEQGAALFITIRPPYWQTWWFRGLIAALLVLGAVGVYRLRIRGIQDRNLGLEQQVQERTAEIEHRRQEMEALYRADEELYRHVHLNDVLQALVDIAVDILQADKGSLLVWEDNKEHLLIRASHGFNPSTFANLKIRPGMGIAGKVAVSGKPVSVEDTTMNPEVTLQITEPEGIRSFMQVPIQIKGETYGVFSADYLQPRRFDETEQRLLLAFAQRAALAIQNAQIVEKEQELAVLEERSRLARELHDAVTQTLFSASLVAEALPATWEKDPQAGRGLLQELRSLSRGALAEMRTLLLELRPAALAETRLEDLLRQLAEAASGREGIPVAVQVEGQAKLPPDVHIAFYRIVQEALNNVVKHARARHVVVRLCFTTQDQPLPAEMNGDQKPPLSGQLAWLVISDDGRGFDPAQVPLNRLGLGIMQERAQAIGADMMVDSQLGLGTRITVQWQAKNKLEG